MVAAWLNDRPPAVLVHPRDECPYSRPFPEGFAECPAYQPMEMVALDLGYRPLGRLWTCRHLSPQRHAEDDRWYGSCVVGDADERERWAAALGHKRLQKLQALWQEMAAMTAPFVERLWRHKRQQLELIEAGKDASAETGQLRAMTRRMIVKLDALLEQRRGLLEELSLPEAACHELIQVALDRLVTQHTVDFQLEVPDEVLSRFSPEMRLFFRPQSQPA